MDHKKVAVVTGGSSGIGRATCLQFGEAGYSVVVNYNSNSDAAQEVVSTIQSAGGIAMAVRADVSKREEIEKMFDQVHEKVGTVDILVNNAGILQDGLLLRMSHDQFLNVLMVNLVGAFHCTRAAVRDMVKSRWGRIISVTSVSAALGNAGQTNYAASKAGLGGFTKSIAREFASRNITANIVQPGLIDTDAIKDASQAARSQLLSLSLLNRIGQPEEVANVISFLASEKSSYVTGATISVDGGMAL